MSLGMTFFSIFIFPGLLYALPAGWFMVWLQRKTEARLQKRLGPPFFQPFFDFVKLLYKNSVFQPGLNGILMTFYPILVSAALIGALSLLPVFSNRQGFTGDLVLLVALLEIPSISLVLAGFTSQSIFGAIGSIREAVLSITYNFSFLLAIVVLALDAKTLQLSILSESPLTLARGIALIAILLCLPAKLHLNPFSQANAEQEIYTGSLTEYSGIQLALWELAHSLEWVALTGLVASLVLPRTGVWYLDVFLFLITSFILVILLAAISAGTARVKIDQAVRFYVRWGLIAGIAALIVALLSPGIGL